MRGIVFDMDITLVDLNVPNSYIISEIDILTYT